MTMTRKRFCLLGTLALLALPWAGTQAHAHVCFGIRIGVGFSCFVVLFVLIFAFTPYFHEVLGGSRTTAYLVAVASVLSLFASLILHELAHALVARRNGLTVAGIDLWAIASAVA